MALLLYRFMYHPLTYDQLHVHRKSNRQQTAEIGYGDIFLFTVGMILFPVGLSWEFGGGLSPLGECSSTLPTALWHCDTCSSDYFWYVRTFYSLR
jgi:hypothetical protein